MCWCILRELLEHPIVLAVSWASFISDNVAMPVDMMTGFPVPLPAL